MSIDNITENRRRRGPCSFCNRVGHSIRSCTNGQVLTLKNTIELIASTSVSEYQFRNQLAYLAKDNPRVFTTYAIIYCGAIVRVDIVNAVELVYQKHKFIISYNLRQQGQERELERERSVALFLAGLEEEEDIIVNDNANKKFAIKSILLNTIELDNISECIICYENIEANTYVKYNCEHSFCKDCVKQSLQTANSSTICCAYCRATVTELSFQLDAVKNEFNEYLEPI
jgi:hypothetical protein